MSQKSKTSYTSKGERRSVSRATCNAVKRDRTYLEKITFKQKAWLKGQNPWITIDNPNPNETNKRKIRIRANQEWGDPRPKVDLRKLSGGSND
jgi:hypothetical protein